MSVYHIVLSAQHGGKFRIFHSYKNALSFCEGLEASVKAVYQLHDLSLDDLNAVLSGAEWIDFSAIAEDCACIKPTDLWVSTGTTSEARKRLEFPCDCQVLAEGFNLRFDTRNAEPLQSVQDRIDQSKVAEIASQMELAQAVADSGLPEIKPLQVMAETDFNLWMIKADESGILTSNFITDFKLYMIEKGASLPISELVIKPHGLVHSYYHWHKYSPFKGSCVGLKPHLI